MLATACCLVGLGLWLGLGLGLDLVSGLLVVSAHVFILLSVAIVPYRSRTGYRAFNFCIYLFLFYDFCSSCSCMNSKLIF